MPLIFDHKYVDISARYHYDNNSYLITVDMTTGFLMDTNYYTITKITLGSAITLENLLCRDYVITDIYFSMINCNYEGMKFNDEVINYLKVNYK